MSKLKNILLAIIFGPIGIFLALILFAVALPFIIIWTVLNWCDKLWRKIRHDPVREIIVDGIFDPQWSEVSTKEGYIDAYRRVSDTIAKLSSARKSQIQYEGFEVFNDPHTTKLNWNDLKMSHTLTTEHAKVRLSFEFGVRIEDDEVYVSDEEYDERNLSDGFPTLIAEITNTEDLPTKKRTLGTYEDIWMIIAVLRGDVKRTRKQLWAHLPEYKVWMVGYKVDGSGFGYRSRFSTGTARKYWFDSKT